jgi:hypothetical protein
LVLTKFSLLGELPQGSESVFKVFSSQFCGRINRSKAGL